MTKKTGTFEKFLKYIYWQKPNHYNKKYNIYKNINLSR